MVQIWLSNHFGNKVSSIWCAFRDLCIQPGMSTFITQAPSSAFISKIHLSMVRFYDLMLQSFFMSFTFSNSYNKKHEYPWWLFDKDITLCYFPPSPLPQWLIYFIVFRRRLLFHACGRICGVRLHGLCIRVWHLGWRKSYSLHITTPGDQNLYMRGLTLRIRHYDSFILTQTSDMRDDKMVLISVCLSHRLDRVSAS